MGNENWYRYENIAGKRVLFFFCNFNISDLENCDTLYLFTVSQKVYDIFFYDDLDSNIGKIIKDLSQHFEILKTQIKKN